jgi:hypothetical protein
MSEGSTIAGFLGLDELFEGRHFDRFCRKLSRLTSEARLASLIYFAREWNCCAGHGSSVSINWPFLIMCINSTPARVAAADQKDLNPSIGRVCRLMAR